jgi:hypothetical protein
MYLEDEFWHRLQCLGKPAGRSAESFAQSDKHGRAIERGCVGGGASDRKVGGENGVSEDQI